MMKIYIIDGKQYLFEEGKQPRGAVEFKKAEPQNKAIVPDNKAKGANKK